MDSGFHVLRVRFQILGLGVWGVGFGGFMVLRFWVLGYFH